MYRTSENKKSLVMNGVAEKWLITSQYTNMHQYTQVYAHMQNTHGG